jgi:hypothetical protein
MPQNLMKQTIKVRIENYWSYKFKILVKKMSLKNSSSPTKQRKGAC